MLKGRMAETLFEEMIRQCGNTVYRFGYEAIVQNLIQLEKKFDRFSEVGKHIRAIPDFIVIDREGRPDFVEVKFRYRTDVALHEESAAIVEKVGKYWNAKIVFVNCWKQPYFQISESPYFDKNRKLIAKQLTSVEKWGIRKKIYDEYEGLVYKYLTPTLVPNKK